MSHASRITKTLLTRAYASAPQLRRAAGAVRRARPRHAPAIEHEPQLERAVVVEGDAIHRGRERRVAAQPGHRDGRLAGVAPGGDRERAGQVRVADRELDRLGRAAAG